MEKIKENALNDFYEFILNSWTYEKLTKNEREQLKKTFTCSPVNEAVKGTYNQRWKTAQAIYTSFLNGCGYDGFKWRDE